MVDTFRGGSFPLGQWMQRAYGYYPFPVVDQPGMWKADQYGRPFDINDLEAP